MFNEKAKAQSEGLINIADNLVKPPQFIREMLSKALGLQDNIVFGLMDDPVKDFATANGVWQTALKSY